MESAFDPGVAAPALGERRFLVFVSAAAGPSTMRALRRLLGAGSLGGHVRVEAVAGIAEASRSLQRVTDEIAVAAGGDGTANLVARALREHAHSPLLGILPLGTGNALAHSLGIGRTAAAVAALRNGFPVAIDVIQTAHPDVRLALASLSAGFEGQFLRRYARLRRWGRLPAAVAALGGASHAVTGIQLVAEGEVLANPDERVFSAGVYNIPCYAGGRRVSRSSDPGDGQAEAVVCPTGRCYWRTLREGFELDRDGVACARRWQQATLESRGPIQFDGEWAAGGTYEMRLERGGLRVLLPPASCSCA